MNTGSQAPISLHMQVCDAREAAGQTAGECIPYLPRILQSEEKRRHDDEPQYEHNGLPDF